MENFRDAELKKWLAEEYEKETEEMEKIPVSRWSDS